MLLHLILASEHGELDHAYRHASHSGEDNGMFPELPEIWIKKGRASNTQSPIQPGCAGSAWRGAAMILTVVTVRI